MTVVRLRQRTFCLILALAGSARTLAQSEPATITQAELIQRTQLLYDAVAPGDPAPWKRFLAEDAIFVDELGKQSTKVGFLADLHALPTGYSGSIQIVKPASLFNPNVAILSYDLDETETVFGAVLHARYHATDTWLYRNGHWQIAASQTLRYYEDPAAGQSAAPLSDYLGTYQLAPGNTLTITQSNGELFAQRGAGKPYKLLPELLDVYFRPGAEGRKIFHRDVTGHVDSIIDRRNNEDLVWKRLEP